MRRRGDMGGGGSLRLVLASAVWLLLAAGAAAQDGQLLPTGFFSGIPDAASSAAQIEADMLAYDAQTDIITAQGGVILRYSGFVARGDRLVFNQRTQDVNFVGNVTVTGPDRSAYTVEGLEVTGGLKEAFLRSLTLTARDGSLITADNVEFINEIRTMLTEASYSPCGLCIDDKGRRIGWRVRAAVMVYDNETETIYLEQPQLELLGIPVAWLPFLYLPDPSKPRKTGFRLPSVDYGDDFGVKLEAPYFVAIGKDTDLLFTPTLLSRQGLLMAAEWVQRFHNGPLTGAISVKASGLYQLDRSAFAGEVGDRDWRGSVQTTGAFTPYDEWTLGWSYTIFTDAGYLKDYRLISSDNLVNEVYATHLGRDDYFDIRLRKFNLLGNVTTSAQDRQASALPDLRYDSVFALAPGWGRIDVSGRLLGVERGTDQTRSVNGIPYVFGYAGQKVHGMFQAGWENQWIGPAGLVATPYLGLRGDAAYYDGASVLLAGPTTLLTATPIAALDVRWPLMAFDGANSHIVEPIAQLVYRGSHTTLPGLTNDNAQSFVFDDANLFSYNRFSGSDRQETGLRLNVGGRYQANFANGGYLDLVAGQSFHLAGLNGLGVADGAQTGNSTGLGMDASYVVLGARGQLFPELEIGGKAQIDPNSWRVIRAGAGARYFNDYDYSLDLDYVFVAANPARGVLANQQEVSVLAGVPVIDYWALKAGGSWDLTANSWLETRAGLAYDDGYLYFGVDYTGTGPTHKTPNDHRFTATFLLKGPDGAAYSF